MDFLNFRDVSFLPNSSIGRLFEDLNNIVGQGVWYDTFQVKNTKWLWLVNDIVTTMNSDEVLCGSFGLYPIDAAGILNSVKEIHFYVLCCEKLNYADYVDKYIASKEYIVTYKTHTGDYFELSSSNETILLSFEARQFPKLPSELEFAQSVLKRMRLSSLAHGILCINKRVTYITNELLTSRHDCVFDLFDIDLQLPKRLANCKLFTRSCSEHPLCDYYPGSTIYCTKTNSSCA